MNAAYYARYTALFIVYAMFVLVYACEANEAGGAVSAAHLALGCRSNIQHKFACAYVALKIERNRRAV